MSGRAPRLSGSAVYGSPLPSPLSNARDPLAGVSGLFPWCIDSVSRRTQRHHEGIALWHRGAVYFAALPLSGGQVAALSVIWYIFRSSNVKSRASSPHASRITASISTCQSRAVLSWLPVST